MAAASIETYREFDVAVETAGSTRREKAVKKSWWGVLLRALMVSAFLATGACSTVIEGTDQPVMISTEPQGAQCVLWRDGERLGEVGQTPASIVVSKSKDDITVKCSEDGYQETSDILTSGGSGWSFGNVAFGLLFGGIGLIVDSASGAMTKYPDSIQVRLVPAGFATVKQRDLFFDALVARHEAEFQEASQLIETQCRAGGAELCGMKRNRLKELHEEALAAVEQQRQAATVESPEPIDEGLREEDDI